MHCPYKWKRVSEGNNQPKISIICQIWLCWEYLTIRNGSECGERHFPEKPAEGLNARGQLPFYVSLCAQGIMIIIIKAFYGKLGYFLLISGAGFDEQHARHGCTGASSCHFMCLSVCEESAFLLSSFDLPPPSQP